MLRNILHYSWFYTFLQGRFHIYKGTLKDLFHSTSFFHVVNSSLRRFGTYTRLVRLCNLCKKGKRGLRYRPSIILVHHRPSIILVHHRPSIWNNCPNASLVSIPANKTSCLLTIKCMGLLPEKTMHTFFMQHKFNFYLLHQPKEKHVILWRKYFLHEVCVI